MGAEGWRPARRFANLVSRVLLRSCRALRCRVEDAPRRSVRVDECCAFACGHRCCRFLVAHRATAHSARARCHVVTHTRAELSIALHVALGVRRGCDAGRLCSQQGVGTVVGRLHRRRDHSRRLHSTSTNRTTLTAGPRPAVVERLSAVVDGGLAHACRCELVAYCAGELRDCLRSADAWADHSGGACSF